jgi:ribonuclease BN (tRNA processing enzyme)
MTTSVQKHTGISVTILGSGTCVPSLTRSSCSVLMAAENTKLLFDVGPGTIRRLLEADTTVFDISHILISHLHPDHTGELASFLFSKKYAGGNNWTTPLTLVGGKGFLSFFNRLEDVYGRHIALESEMLNICELDNTRPDHLEIGSMTIESIPVTHTDESIAFRVTSADNRSVVYSGDTDVCDNLVTLAQDADLLICESSFPDGLKSDGHLTPSLSGEMATRANVRKLVLTHLYPECDGEDIEEQCRKTYDGPLLIAEDLMKMTL